MTFAPAQVGMLTAKLDPSVVKKNPKGHDYIEGWRAIAEANRIFGHDGWAREVVSLAQVADAYETPSKNGPVWRVAYRATVRVTVWAGDRTVIREGTGYGSGITKDLNDAHEGAVKEAETDAMKRALMTFGNPFGLALYDKERTNVGYDEPVRELSESATRMIADIRNCDTAAALSEWLLKHKPAVKALDDYDREPVIRAYDELKAALTFRDTVRA